MADGSQISAQIGRDARKTEGIRAVLSDDEISDRAPIDPERKEGAEQIAVGVRLSEFPAFRQYFQAGDGEIPVATAAAEPSDLSCAAFRAAEEFEPRVGELRPFRVQFEAFAFAQEVGKEIAAFAESAVGKLVHSVEEVGFHTLIIRLFSHKVKNAAS